ncbi:MAG: TolC family protein [Elusimicrobia bacterium]|nr:TolC family protein [Elusimicrobiota bacterium]
MIKKISLFISVFSMIAVLAVKIPGQETETLSSLIKRAKNNNPEILAARARWQASKSKVVQEKTWEDPSLIVEYWSIPEGGFDVSSAMEKMYGISQKIPFPGKNYFKGKTAKAFADEIEWAYKDTELNILQQLQASYGEYYFLSKAIETYGLYVDIMKSYAKTAESKYVVGKTTQNDVLKAQIETEKMSAMITNLSQEKETKKAQINLLIGKGPSEALGNPEELLPAPIGLTIEELTTRALQNSPLSKMQEARFEQSVYRKKSANLEYAPDFDLAFRRKKVNEEWAGSDIMLGINIPLWFWKKRAGVIEMAREKEASNQDNLNAKLMVQYLIKEHTVALDNTLRLINLYRDSIIPKAEQSVKVSGSAYKADKRDFLEFLTSISALLDYKLSYYQYIADYYRDLSELEAAVGVALN